MKWLGCRRGVKEIQSPAHSTISQPKPVLLNATLINDTSCYQKKMKRFWKCSVINCFKHWLAAAHRVLQFLTIMSMRAATLIIFSFNFFAANFTLKRRHKHTSQITERRRPKKPFAFPTDFTPTKPKRIVNDQKTRHKSKIALEKTVLHSQS